MTTTMSPEARPVPSFMYHHRACDGVVGPGRGRGHFPWCTAPRRGPRSWRSTRRCAGTPGDGGGGAVPGARGGDGRGLRADAYDALRAPADAGVAHADGGGRIGSAGAHRSPGRHVAGARAAAQHEGGGRALPDRRAPRSGQCSRSASRRSRHDAHRGAGGRARAHRARRGRAPERTSRAASRARRATRTRRGSSASSGRGSAATTTSARSRCCSGPSPRASACPPIAPVAALVAQHHTLAADLDALEERLAALAAQPVPEPTLHAAIAALTTRYTHGLWQHIDAEDSVLFPRARRACAAGCRRCRRARPNHAERAAVDDGARALALPAGLLPSSAVRGDGCPACPSSAPPATASSAPGGRTRSGPSSATTWAERRRKRAAGLAVVRAGVGSCAAPVRDAG